MDWFKGKKTFIANIVVILVAAAGAVGETGWISAEIMLYVMGLLNIVLRMVTTGPAAWVGRVS